MSDSRCILCGGSGWVCEEHPDHPAEHGSVKPCAGAAMSCPECQTGDARPQLPIDWVSFISTDDK